MWSVWVLQPSRFTCLAWLKMVGRWRVAITGLPSSRRITLVHPSLQVAIYCNQGIPLVLLTQTLTSVSPGGSSATSQRDTKSTLTSPRSLGLRNPIRWSLLFTQTDIRSFPCYTKNYYLVLLTKVYHLVSKFLVFLTKFYYLVPFSTEVYYLVFFLARLD